MSTRIICDLNEEWSGIPSLLEKRHDVLVERRRLDTGDYIVSAAIGVERKAEGDLVRSVLEESLLPQLDRLASAYEIAVFLIEGDGWKGNLKLKTPMLARLLQQITFRENIVPWYSPSEKYSARLLAALAKEEQAKKPASPQALLAVTNARSPEDVLRALPDVGPAAARKLLTRFGTAAAAMSASREELQAAIGPKVGQAVFDLLNRPGSECT
jgi:ERCC4-type nuclease